jgi:polysaccharide export outer membrane protein
MREVGQTKTYVCAGIIGSLVFCLSTLIAYSQPDQGALSKEKTEAKSMVDNESYVIGPEDVLHIHVWKEEDLSRTVPVRMDGNISLPLIRDIKAAGFTPLQLEAAITERLKGFYDNPNVSVTVMEINSFRVYVSGEVKTPGVYRLRSETSLLQVIPMAGGFTEWAKKKKILVIRKENGKEKRFVVNYKKAMEGDDPSSNVILKPGDTIIVP